MNTTPSDQTRLDRLSDSELVAQIDRCVDLVRNPNCSPHFVGGVCLEALLFLNERAERSARCLNKRMLHLTWLVTILTAVCAVSAVWQIVSGK